LPVSRQGDLFLPYPATAGVTPFGAGILVVF
jgi:hypothetical protein